MNKTKTIGVDVAAPTGTCSDMACPFHGSLRVRGRTFVGTVVSSRMQKSAVVQWKRNHYIPKYERKEVRFTRISVHNPSCINAKDGDDVKIMECRPLSKTKSFVVVQNLGRNIMYLQKEVFGSEDRGKKRVQKEEAAREAAEEEEGHASA